jgi:hypothetical protein
VRSNGNSRQWIELLDTQLVFGELENYLLVLENITGSMTMPVLFKASVNFLWNIILPTYKPLNWSQKPNHLGELQLSFKTQLWNITFFVIIPSSVLNMCWGLASVVLLIWLPASNYLFTSLSLSTVGDEQYKDIDNV